MNPDGINNSITFKRPGRPNKSGEAKEYSGNISKHLGITKKPSKDNIHANKLQSKCTVSVGVNNKRKSTLPMEDL